MKVAILSMQEVKNYGSFLQAWSLKHNIESLGHTCDFINIVPGEQLGEYKQSRFVKIQKLVTRLWGWDFMKRFNTIRKFQGRFAKEFLPELGVHQGEVNTNHYDVVVIGSDEVFNCAQKTWFGFSTQLFGEGLNADKVISYAGSFGATDIEKLDAIGKKEKVADLMKRMNAVSIRDLNSLKTVEALTGKTPLKHVDPVLIWNYDNEIEARFKAGFKLSDYGLEKDKYMVVYTYPGRITDIKEISAIKAYAQKRRLSLVSVGHYFPWCDDVVIPHPFEVLAIFKHAACIVTDTFHGSVFSLKYNKNFCTIVRGMNTNKLTHLLNQFGLQDRIACRPNMIEEILGSPIEYQSINKLIVIEKERSLEYLKKHLTLSGNSLNGI